MKKALILILYILIASILWEVQELHAGERALRERYAQAKRYAAEGKIDFAFMEFRALLEDPEGPLAQKALFALGEYYFRQHSPREAKQAFQKFTEASSEEVPRFLAIVYLLQCARFLEDVHAAHTLESRLKEALSSKKLFLAFEGDRTEEWTSPLGNHFQLREFVDRMEIFLNGNAFYTVTLP